MVAAFDDVVGDVRGFLHNFPIGSCGTDCDHLSVRVELGHTHAVLLHDILYDLLHFRVRRHFDLVPDDGEDDVVDRVLTEGFLRDLDHVLLHFLATAAPFVLRDRSFGLFFIFGVTFAVTAMAFLSQVYVRFGDQVSHQHLAPKLPDSLRDGHIPNITLVSVDVDEASAFRNGHERIVVPVRTRPQTLQNCLFQPVSRLAHVKGLLDVFHHFVRVVHNFGIENQLYHFLLFSLGAVDVADVLRQNESAHFHPVVVQNLFADFMSAHTVGPESLHPEVVDETILDRVFNIGLNGVVSD